MHGFKFYAITFIAGAVLSTIFLLYLSNFDFFGNAPFDYQTLAFFIILYLIGGASLAYVKHSWSLGEGVFTTFLFGLPMVAIFYLVAFGDKNPLQTVPRLVGIISPWFSAFIGWAAGFKWSRSGDF